MPRFRGPCRLNRLAFDQFQESRRRDGGAFLLKAMKSTGGSAKFHQLRLTTCLADLFCRQLNAEILMANISRENRRVLGGFKEK